MADVLPETTRTPASYLNIELMFDLDMVLSGAEDFGYGGQIKAAGSPLVADLPTVVAGDVCAVCMEDFRPEEGRKQIPCGHVYHETCISSWLSVGDSCPLCRRHISGERSEAPKRLQV